MTTAPLPLCRRRKKTEAEERLRAGEEDDRSLSARCADVEPELGHLMRASRVER
jgi:hypothetical protein